MTDVPWDEDARQAALNERLRVAALPDADARLVLVRIDIPRWSVIQWWLLESIRDWRTLVTEHMSTGNHTASIKAAIRGGKARTVRVVPTGHLVQAIGNGYITLDEAANARYSIDCKKAREGSFHRVRVYRDATPSGRCDHCGIGERMTERCCEVVDSIDCEAAPNTWREASAIVTCWGCGGDVCRACSSVISYPWNGQRRRMRFCFNCQDQRKVGRATPQAIAAGTP